VPEEEVPFGRVFSHALYPTADACAAARAELMHRAHQQRSRAERDADEWLQAQKEREQKKLAHARAELADFEHRHGPDIPQQVSTLRKQLDELRGQAPSKSRDSKLQRLQVEAVQLNLAELEYARLARTIEEREGTIAVMRKPGPMTEGITECFAPRGTSPAPPNAP